MNKDLMKASLARALWTFGEVFLGMVGSARLFSEVDWPYVMQSCLFATMLAFVKCLMTGLPEVTTLGTIRITDDGQKESWVFESDLAPADLATKSFAQFKIEKNNFTKE